MKLDVRGLAAIAAAALCLMGNVDAAVFNSRPATYSPMGGEPTLDEVFNGTVMDPDGLVYSGAAIDPTTSQTDLAIFSPLGGESVATFIISIAGFAPDNTFGIYEFGDTSNRVEIFDGVTGGNPDVTVEFTGGNVYLDGAEALG
ncbi:MAG: hypothetical protein N2C14_24015, partial [Planctomycetales bacterium]